MKKAFVLLIAILLIPAVSASFGWEKLDSGKVLHMWNDDLSYYFNASSGLQFTNNYNEYWSKNIICLGSNDGSGWVYKCNEGTALVNFAWNFSTDNETFVEAVGIKNITLAGNKVEAVLKYRLDDEEPDLEIVPSFKNVDSSDITDDLRFVWRAQEIAVGGEQENNTLNVGWEHFNNLSNSSLNELYTSLLNNEYIVYKENLWFRTKWQPATYKLQIKANASEYNAPINLIFETTGLNIGQTKKVTYYWIDADCQAVWASGNGAPPFGGTKFFDNNYTIPLLRCYKSGAPCPAPPVPSACSGINTGYLACRIQHRLTGSGFQTLDETPGGFNCNEEGGGATYAEVVNYNLIHDNPTDFRCRAILYTGAPPPVGCGIDLQGGQTRHNIWLNNHTPNVTDVSTYLNLTSFNQTCNYTFSDADGDAQNTTGGTYIQWFLEGKFLVNAYNNLEIITNDARDFVCCVDAQDDVFRTGNEIEVCSGDFNTDWQYAIISSLFLAGLLLIYLGTKFDEKHYPMKILLIMVGMLVFLGVIYIADTLGVVDLGGIYSAYLWLVYTAFVLLVIFFINLTKYIYK